MSLGRHDVGNLDCRRRTCSPRPTTLTATLQVQGIRTAHCCCYHHCLHTARTAQSSLGFVFRRSASILYSRPHYSRRGRRGLFHPRHAELQRPRCPRCLSCRLLSVPEIYSIQAYPPAVLSISAPDPVSTSSRSPVVRTPFSS